MLLGPAKVCGWESSWSIDKFWGGLEAVRGLSIT